MTNCLEDFDKILKLINRKDDVFQIYSCNNWNSKLEDELFELFNCDLEDIIFSILVRDRISISPRDIPMFSNFDDCTLNICKLLECTNNNGLTMIELGKLFREYDAKDGAYYKYGESHAKTAELLGLVTIRNCENQFRVFLTNIGYLFLKYPDQREKIIIRLILTMKLAQITLHEYYCGKNCVCDNMMFISYTTRVRRMSNVKRIFDYLCTSSEYDFTQIINKLNFTCKEN